MPQAVFNFSICTITCKYSHFQLLEEVLFIDEIKILTLILKEKLNFVFIDWDLQNFGKTEVSLNSEYSILLQ